VTKGEVKRLNQQFQPFPQHSMNQCDKRNDRTSSQSTGFVLLLLSSICMKVAGCLQICPPFHSFLFHSILFVFSSILHDKLSWEHWTPHQNKKEHNVTVSPFPHKRPPPDTKAHAVLPPQGNLNLLPMKKHLNKKGNASHQLQIVSKGKTIGRKMTTMPQTKS